MPSSCALSVYQRCGIAYRPCTASTSACTDASLASFDRLRLAIHELEVAHAIVDRLVGQQRVQHERARPQPGLESGGHGFGRGLAHLAVGCRQQREAGFERGRLAVDLDADRGDLLVEQALPRARAGDRLLGEHHLFGFAQQVRSVAPGRAQVMTREREARIGEQRLGLGVVELGPLELEEQQLGADDRRLLVDLLHAARRAPDRSCWSRSRG